MRKISACKVCFLACCLLLLSAPASAQWKQAAGPYPWKFPRDHGAHPAYRTEWWYFTGNLSDATGARYGYQLTFFRQGIRFKPPDPAGPWDIRDVYLGHFALSDITGKKFHYGERISRTGPGLAGAREENLDVWLLDWSARMQSNAIVLNARDKGMALDLTLLPRKPLVFHGRNGLSRKGPQEGQASYYTSFTDLETTGFLTTSANRRVVVKGRSWFDHEFGSNQLAAEQTGWDWFSLALSDGREVMLYFLRRSDGSVEPASSGTLVEPDGKTRHLSLAEITVTVLEHWKSPASSGRYPSRWAVRIPAAGIDLTVAAALADQELITKGSTAVTYWEGAIAGTGTSRNRPVTCQGYAELTGYAGSLGGLF
ncbi:MAG: lipocalin-like domain-containing protein [Syntrophales bacterium]